jgi:hypothetical protein
MLHQAVVKGIVQYAARNSDRVVVVGNAGLAAFDAAASSKPIYSVGLATFPNVDRGAVSKEIQTYVMDTFSHLKDRVRIDTGLRLYDTVRMANNDWEIYATISSWPAEAFATHHVDAAEFIAENTCMLQLLECSVRVFKLAPFLAISRIQKNAALATKLQMMLQTVTAAAAAPATSTSTSTSTCTTVAMPNAIELIGTFTGGAGVEVQQAAAGGVATSAAPVHAKRMSLSSSNTQHVHVSKRGRGASTGFGRVRHGVGRESAAAGASNNFATFVSNDSRGKLALTRTQKQTHDTADDHEHGVFTDSGKQSSKVATTPAKKGLSYAKVAAAGSQSSRSPNKSSKDAGSDAIVSSVHEDDKREVVGARSPRQRDVIMQENSSGIRCTIAGYGPPTSAAVIEQCADAEPTDVVSPNPCSNSIQHPADKLCETTSPACDAASTAPISTGSNKQGHVPRSGGGGGGGGGAGREGNVNVNALYGKQQQQQKQKHTVSQQRRQCMPARAYSSHSQWQDRVFVNGYPAPDWAANDHQPSAYGIDVAWMYPRMVPPFLHGAYGGGISGAGFQPPLPPVPPPPHPCVSEPCMPSARGEDGHTLPHACGDGYADESYATCGHVATDAMPSTFQHALGDAGADTYHDSATWGAGGAQHHVYPSPATQFAAAARLPVPSGIAALNYKQAIEWFAAQFIVIPGSMLPHERPALLAHFIDWSSLCALHARARDMYLGEVRCLQNWYASTTTDGAASLPYGFHTSVPPFNLKTALELFMEAADFVEDAYALANLFGLPASYESPSAFSADVLANTYHDSSMEQRS